MRCSHISEEIKATITITDKIGAGNVVPDPPRRGQTFTLAAIGSAGEDQVFSDYPVFGDFLVVADVLEICIEGVDPLFQATFNLLPLAFRHNDRKDVKG